MAKSLAFGETKCHSVGRLDSLRVFGLLAARFFSVVFFS